MKHIPAVMYYMIVRQFAKSHGLRFFTIKEQRNARELYESVAKKLN